MDVVKIPESDRLRQNTIALPLPGKVQLSTADRYAAKTDLPCMFPSWSSSRDIEGNMLHFAAYL